MNCEQYEQLLMKYESGDVSADELAQMSAHEDICPECARKRRLSDDIMAGLADLRTDVPEMPKDFHEKWTREIRKTHKQTGSRILRFVGMAAACLVVVFLAVSTGTKLQQSIRRQTLSSTESLAYDADVEYEAEESYYVPEAAAYDAGGGAYEAMNLAGSTAAYGNGMQLKSRGMTIEESGEVPLYEDSDDTDAETPDLSQDKKIVRTASIDITTNDFDQALEQIRNICGLYKGWTSQSSVTTTSSGLKRANIAVRIPSESLDLFLEGTAGIGRVTSQSETAEDVTENYRDTQTRLRTQQMLLERLQSLVTTTTKLSDLLALEDQIADKQYEIDRLTTSLRRTDKAVDYSSVSITLREEKRKEVAQTKTVSFGERILAAFEVGIESFAEFLADTLLLIIAVLPYLICLALILVIVIIFIRRRKHK